MAAHRMLRGTIGVSLLLAAGVARAGGPADADALQKQLQEVRRKRSACGDRLFEIERKIAESPAVAPLLKARKEAHEAYQAKLKADPALAAANKAHDGAWREFTDLVRERLAASEEAKPVYKQLEWIEDAEAEIGFRRDLAEFELMNRRSPIHRAVEKDPQVKALARALESVERDWMRDRNEENTAARRKAEAALAEARKAKLDAMPEAKRLREQMQEADKEVEKLRKERQEADQKLAEVRQKIEHSDDPPVKAADGRVTAARKLVTEANEGQELKAARDAADKASAAATTKVRELLAVDPEAAALAKERDALDKELADLRTKLREAKKE